MTVSDFRQNLAAAVLQTSMAEAVFVQRHGTTIGVRVRPEAHAELQDAWEELEDLRAYRAARDEDGSAMPWEQVKRRSWAGDLSHRGGARREASAAEGHRRDARASRGGSSCCWLRTRDHPHHGAWQGPRPTACASATTGSSTRFATTFSSS